MYGLIIELKALLPDSIEESKPGELKRALKEVCDHRFRSPVTEKGYNLIVCTVCGKSRKEGELCEWRKR